MFLCSSGVVDVILQGLTGTVATKLSIAAQTQLHYHHPVRFPPEMKQLCVEGITKEI